MMTGQTSPGRAASKSTAHGAWFTLEAIVTLLTPRQGSTLLLKVGHANGGQGRCGMMFCLIVMNLMNWDSGVHHGWLDSLLLDNWLNGLWSKLAVANKLH